MARFDRERVVVLAAGRGRRMGGPKALLHVGDRPLWRHQGEALDALNLRAYWVVSEDVRAALVDSGAAPSNLILGDSAAPMFESVLAGLHALAPDDIDGVFILPVDVPAPAQPVWTALAQNEKPSVPTCEGKRGHPVHLPRRWIERTILAPGAALHTRLDLVLGGDSVTIETGDPSILLNLNEPSDLENWMRTR